MIFLSAVNLNAQSSDRQTLEKNKREIENEIRLINKMLQETRKTAEVNLNQLVMLNNQISRREKLLSSISDQISLLDKQINTVSDTIQHLGEKLEVLKTSYASMIRQASRNQRSHQLLMFIFSSENFSQAYQRLKYYKQLAHHRQQQGQEIIITTGLLEEKRKTLEQQKKEQQDLLAQHRSAKQSLEREKSRQNMTVTQLRKKEKDLDQRLKQQQKAAQELQKAIEEVIAEEIRKAKEAAQAQGREAPEMFGLTPEEQLLSDNFTGNKGKLPWPLERGIITGHFGEQPHPVLPGIKVSNNGIDISTTQGAKVRAIFNGTVTRIVSIPGAFYAVIVRHGEYLTVYSNLSEVFVSSGQQINVRHELGVAATDRRDSKTYINLQIWHGNNKLNPAQWIAMQK